MDKIGLSHINMSKTEEKIQSLLGKIWNFLATLNTADITKKLEVVFQEGLNEEWNSIKEAIIFFSTMANSGEQDNYIVQMHVLVSQYVWNYQIKSQNEIWKEVTFLRGLQSRNMY